MPLKTYVSIFVYFGINVDKRYTLVITSLSIFVCLFPEH